ncbi:MAG: helix-turn-helix domain-containing protein [Firmicutes bacterium]|nr:helix-turn-helix domain-containing protein [Bacillota bacterium]MBQ7057711.1 helix-turn-helix domain-containing protein [Bacillota bacterium]
MPLSGSLGERIAKLRTENRISQKELADLLYVNQGTVSRWEKGTRFPEEDLIYKMAERFGVDPEVLLSASTERTPVILLVDQEKELAKLVPLMEKLVPEAKIFGASSVKKVVQLVKDQYVRIAFLETEIGQEGGGLLLAEGLMRLVPEINIIFLTNSPAYMAKAFRMHASGYILKPAEEDDILHEVRHLRYPVKALSAW